MSAPRLRTRLLVSATHRRRGIRKVAWLGVAATFSLIAASIAAGAAPSSYCFVEVPPADPKPGEVSKGAVLSSSGEGFRLRFDDARDVASDVVVLTNLHKGTRLEPGDHIVAEISGYLENEDHRPIYPTRGNPYGEVVRINPHAEVVRVTAAGNVEVCIELDAGKVSGAGPGQYTGTVLVSGDDLDFESAIPVVVTFRSSRSIALGLAFAGVLLGLLVKMFTELAAAHRTPGGGAPSTLRQYVAQWTFPTALILGGIAGWLGYVQNYDGSAVWGSGDTDWLKLFGTCFAFQLGTVGGMDLARRLAGEVPTAPTPAPAG